MNSRFIIFLPIFLLVAPLAEAQFTKGNLFLGAYVNSSADYQVGGPYASSPYAQRAFSVNPTIGIFMNEKTAIGGSLGYNSSFREYGGTTTLTDRGSALSIGAFARRYFAISEKFFFAVGGGLYFERGTSTRTQVDPVSTVTSDNNYYNVSVSARPLFVFFPSPHWGFDAGVGSIGYSHNQNLSNSQSGNYLYLAAGSITLGINYYFRND